MVPLLEHYPVTGVLLTGALLYAVFFAGARSANPLTIFLVIALTFIPVAGVADQAADDSARPGLSGSGSLSAFWSVASRTLFFRMLQGRRKSQRHPPTSVRKRQAGSRCRLRWSSCPYSCWR